MNSIIPICYLSLIYKFLKLQVCTVESTMTSKLNEKFNRLCNSLKSSNSLNSSPHGIKSIQNQPISSTNKVINLSSAPLLPSDLEFLSKGLNFSLGASKLNAPQLLSCFEPVMYNFNTKDKHEIRSIISSSAVKFNHKRLASFPLPANLKLLKNNPSYIITRADKGRCVVILNKSDYVNKVLDHLNDNSTYIQINKDLNNSIQTKLNKLLSKLCNSGDIDMNQSKSLKCYNGSSPYLYGLPKIHMSNISIRPIVN